MPEFLIPGPNVRYGPHTRRRLPDQHRVRRPRRPRRRHTGPIAEQAAGGAELVVNLNASPYYAGRVAERERMLATRATDSSCALVYVNQVGGQDELVFDGASLVFDANGELIASAPQFVEHTLIVDIEVLPVFRKRLLDPRGRAMAAPLPIVSVSPSRGDHEGTHRPA